MYHGLSPKDVQQLAYDFANENNLKLQATWKDNEMTGVEWFAAFLKWNEGLLIRSPGATSLSMATSSNH